MPARAPWHAPELQPILVSVGMMWLRKLQSLAPAGWVPQQYRPAEVEARVYYRPGAQGREAELGELLERRRTRREAEGEHSGDHIDDREDVERPSGEA